MASTFSRALRSSNKIRKFPILAFLSSAPIPAKEPLLNPRITRSGSQKSNLLNFIGKSGGYRHHSSLVTSKLPHQISIIPSRYFSTSNGSEDLEKENAEIKHQEITGPTVERDVSALANESREVLETMMKNMHGLSKALVIVGLLNLGLGSWISHVTKDATMFAVSMQSVLAFGASVSLAFMLTRALKHMYFFKKMEEQSRLQILTLSLQITKQLNVLFVRYTGVSHLCVVGTAVALLYVVLSG